MRLDEVTGNASFQYPEGMEHEPENKKYWWLKSYREALEAQLKEIDELMGEIKMSWESWPEEAEKKGWVRTGVSNAGGRHLMVHPEDGKRARVAASLVRRLDRISNTLSLAKSEMSFLGKAMAQKKRAKS